MECTDSNYIHTAVNLLRQVPYATLATVDLDGNPWNSPVAAVYDEKLSIYWFSDKNSRHSQNVRATTKVFIVIYNSTIPEGTGAKGIYIEAEAKELDDLDLISRARYLKRGDQSHDARLFTGAHDRRVYMATPLRMWMNDVERTRRGKFVRDYRVELSLDILANTYVNSVRCF